jgi:hypothetical protein
MSGNKKGNPAHDSSTGEFTTSQHKATAHEKGDLSEPKRGRSLEGKARAAAAKEQTGGGAAPAALQGAAKPSVSGPEAVEDVGRAPTMMGAAPAKQESKAPATGSVPLDYKEFISHSGDRKDRVTNVARPGVVGSSDTARELRAPEKAEAAHAAQVMAGAPSMSEQIKQKRGDVEAVATQAYHDKRKELQASGVPEDAAHEQAKAHAGKVWDDNQAAYFAQRGEEHQTMQGMAPSSPGVSGVGPTSVPRRQQIADLANLKKPAATQRDQGPPTMQGSSRGRAATMAGVGSQATPNTMKPSSTIPGMGPTPNTPAVPSIPGAPGGGGASTAPTAQTAPTAPGAAPESGSAPVTRMGGKQGGGVMPWGNYSTGAAIGGGMWTPGGTVAPTAAAAAQGVHGLLNYRDRGINPEATAAKQSAALKNETQRATAALNSFSGRVSSANKQGRYASP